MLKKALELSLSQILNVIWVWQCEFIPTYSPLWQNCKSSLRGGYKPESHIADYNHLLEQICMSTPQEQLDYTQDAMKMLAYNIAIGFFGLIEKPTIESEDVQFQQVLESLQKLKAERIDAVRQLKEPSDEAKQEARTLIKTLLAVETDGYPVYAYANLAITILPVKPCERRFLSGNKPTR